MCTTLLIVMSLSLFLTGCLQESKPQIKAKTSAEDPMCNPTPIRYQKWEEMAIAEAKAVKGVDKAVAVQIDDELDVAIEVSNFNRFRLETIEKEVSQALKKKFPETKIHVTSDKKLMNELQKLSNEPWAGEQEKACKQKKKLKKIEKDMKG
ncbi:YhcN/YlaJ family sporulation lipoprotein [Brevibacillus migulae]|uniref:YhcN/YlaJ family sporulation lipoprotein n=1 Tax=Brevibacillus migulae TaxID=1644114 RepID=UPI00106E0D1F|nr:YhcN/YlaJ family sporulation lipoprotein [Brevibacillus migulae]